jgi:hypothetical protein
VQVADDSASCLHLISAGCLSSTRTGSFGNTAVSALIEKSCSTGWLGSTPGST